MPRPLPPRKPHNAECRTREFLTPREVDQLLEAARKCCRHKERDSTIILMMFTHGLRVSELVSLTWSQLDLEEGLFHVRRLKRGKPATHYLTSKELRALRQMRKQTGDFTHVFISERLAPVSAAGIRRMIRLVGLEAGLGPYIHPHMLRHATGYKLANDGRDTRTIQDYLGHRNINHTVRYTEIAPERFKGLFSNE